MIAHAVEVFGGELLLVFVVAGLLLLLVASLAARLTRMWLERRRGAAGSRLHVRLVLLFGVVAAVPAVRFHLLAPSRLVRVLSASVTVLEPP
mgnify:CR=1 FL=1